MKIKKLIIAVVAILVYSTGFFHGCCYGYHEATEQVEKALGK
jgi:hypothetical protein